MTALFTLVSAECLKCDARRLVDEARRHAGLPDWAGERPLKQAHIENLMDRIKAGRAIPFNWKVIQVGENTFREDGNHSANAIIRLDEAGLLPVQQYVVFRATFKADSKDGVAELFWQIDSQLSVRSKLDLAGAYIGLSDSLKDLSRDGAKAALDGIRWHETKIEGTMMPAGEEMYTLFNVEAYHPFIRWYATTNLAHMKPVNRKAAVAAMYAQFSESEGHTKEFWGTFLTGESVVTNSPVGRLRDLFDAHNAGNAASSNAIRQGRSKTPKSTVVGDTLTPDQLYSFCNIAWNHAASGEKAVETFRLPSSGKRVNPLTVDLEGKFVEGGDAA
jgi:hypothetical protein